LIIEGDLPPELWISALHDGDWFGYRSNVVLLAGARDPQDGELRVHWSSDVDGGLPAPNWSTGSRGRHVLTAITRDSAGHVATRELTIYIGVRPPGQSVFLPAARVGR
jgi:hypothetical protein